MSYGRFAVIIFIALSGFSLGLVPRSLGSLLLRHRGWIALPQAMSAPAVVAAANRPGRRRRALAGR